MDRPQLHGGRVHQYILKCKERPERQNVIIMKTQYLTLMLEPLIYYAEHY